MEKKSYNFYTMSRRKPLYKVPRKCISSLKLYVSIYSLVGISCSRSSKEEKIFSHKNFVHPRDGTLTKNFSKFIVSTLNSHNFHQDIRTTLKIQEKATLPNWGPPGHT